MSGEGDPHHGDDDETAADDALMLRPDTVTLPDDALVPECQFVRPPPNRFTHEVVVDEPYRLAREDRAGEPHGVLPAGTRVVVLAEGQDDCRVVDDTGLHVVVRRANLQELRDT